MKGKQHVLNGIGEGSERSLKGSGRDDKCFHHLLGGHESFTTTTSGPGVSGMVVVSSVVPVL